MKCFTAILLAFSVVAREASMRLEFDCANCEVKSKLSETIINLDTDVVKELKMCGCAGTVLISTVQMFNNLSVLDFSNSKYRNEYRSRSEQYLDLQKLLHGLPITKLNASYNNLTHLHMVLPPLNVTVLDLSHNQLDLLHSRAFINLKKLELLDLSNNNLFAMGEFKNLPNIKRLHLENNRIGIYECEAFGRIRNPVTIYLSWNKIHILRLNCGHINNVIVRLGSVESVTYKNGVVEVECNQHSFRKLQYLRIGRFQIIDTSVRRSLISMKLLRVTKAQTSEFDFFPLREMANLEYLDISGNGFKRIKNWDVLRKLENLKFLSAQGNQIENAFEIIPNLSSTIVRLNLSGNNVGRINSNFFCELGNLEEIGLQGVKLQFGDSNPFRLLDDLKVLEVSNNDLSNVDFTKLASTLDRLEVFEADGCRLKNACQIIELFGGGIRKIDLSGNDLSEVNLSLAFSSFKLLDELRLSHCQIKNVADLRLKPRSIRSLDLSGNPIGEVNNSTFSHLRQLGKLYLSDTNLSISYPDPFEYIVSWRSLVFLSYLDLSKNDLSTLNFSMLEYTMGKVYGINLSNCQIQNVSNVIQLLNPSIQRLDLSGNLIGEWNASSLHRFDDIRFLNLANTSLRNIDLTFDEMRILEKLNISFNRLERLEMIPHYLMETLDLRGNELSDIPNFTRENLPHLKSLGISGNRLSCEFLERLNEWGDLTFIDNNWKQKDVNCCPFEKSCGRCGLTEKNNSPR